MDKKGILFAVGAYFLWGVLPVFWKQLHAVPAFETMAHRIIWSFTLLVVLLLARRQWGSFRQVLANRSMRRTLALTALLLGFNWGVYIWAVGAGHIVEASLGYFINPLLSVLMGVVFLRERLRAGQWAAVGLAAVGVVYLSIYYGTPPWIALSLAVSFGLYGLLKKQAPVEALQGMTVEMTAMLLPAIGYLVYLESRGVGLFGHAEPKLSLLLMGTSVVTIVPIFLFNSAARLIPLSMMGILQYINPTGQFLLGVLVYGEPFTQGQMIGFGIIWTALLLYWFEGFFQRRKAAAPEMA